MRSFSEWAINNLFDYGVTVSLIMMAAPIIAFGSRRYTWVVFGAASFALWMSFIVAAGVLIGEASIFGFVVALPIGGINLLATVLGALSAALLVDFRSLLSRLRNR